MITRTFTKNFFTATIYDEKTNQLVNEEAKAFGTVKQAEKLIRQEYKQKGLNLCKLEFIKSNRSIYGCSEVEFASVAHIIKDVDENDPSDPENTPDTEE